MGGSTISRQLIPYGNRATKPANPTKIGYNFVMWTTEANGSTPYDFNKVVEEDTVIYALWSIKMYSLSFNTRGGSSIANQIVKHGNTPVVPVDPTKTGHVFKGWYTSTEFTTLYNFSAPIVGDVVVYAKWDLLQRTLTFKGMGGSSFTRKVNYGSTLTDIPSSSKMGYSFNG